MEETGFHRFGGNLDPRAQEFVPRTHQLPFVSNHVFYPYTSPPPPYFYPSPPPGPPTLCDGSFPGYPPPFSSSPAYVGMDHHSLVPSVNNSWPPRTMPSRALLLTMVPADVSESTVRRDLEIFGDVRAVQMERVREGMVTVHFYNLSQAQEALTEIQEQHMQQQFRLRRHYETVVAQNSLNLDLYPSPQPMPPPAPGLIAGRAVWAQFTAPVASSLPDGNNQGTLVIFNLDSDVSPNSLKQTFEAFGPVKELRETPMKKHQKFVEFYDVRDAAKALTEMNGKEILSKQIVIEFSRPGGGLSKKHSKFTGSFTNARLNVVNNYSVSSPSRIMPPPPSPTSQQLSCRISFCSPVRPYSSPAQSSDRRSSSYSKGNPKANCDRRSSIQNSMASLSVNYVCADKSTNAKPSSSKKSSRKTGNNHATSFTSTSKQQQQQQIKGNKPWKGLRQTKEYDPRFLINEDAIMESNCRDSRTTVMIKNIPNKYSQKLLLNMLDNHCIHCNEQIADGDDQPLSSYDFVYLPIDFVNKCNVGYGFVNMTSPEATLRLYKAFHRQSWEVFNSRKICEVTYARLQGVEALKEHFKNSKFPCEADEYMPVVFSPPRDGRRRLTDPIPIIGRSNSFTVSQADRTCSSSPAVSSKEEESSENCEMECGDFQELEEIADDDHINNAGGGGHDDNDVDGVEDVNNGGDQYYDGDDVSDGIDNLINIVV